jgi:hypothetical protein
MHAMKCHGISTPKWVKAAKLAQKSDKSTSEWNRRSKTGLKPIRPTLQHRNDKEAGYSIDFLKPKSDRGSLTAQKLSECLFMPKWASTPEWVKDSLAGFWITALGRALYFNKKREKLRILGLHMEPLISWIAFLVDDIDCDYIADKFFSTNNVDTLIQE